MNRAMFSGVAGLKAHQTRMDVIGNNIANVNTYGFKAQRAIFSDIYYQTLRSASAGTANRAGIDPSTVGYGSTLAAVQSQMTSSSSQSTGYGTDVAIQGEGFLQVMDADGNIFYTRAGILGYDSNGYLKDMNGNFVLGAATADGAPASQKIKLDSLGSVDPARAQKTEKINGIEYTVTATNPTKAGNISFTLGAGDSLPAGLKAKAEISSTGGISILLNSYESFRDLTELNTEINKAILEANGGKAHAAGDFTVTTNVPDPIQAAGGLTGAQLTSGNYDVTLGTCAGTTAGVDPVATGVLGGIKFMTTSSNFLGDGNGTFELIKGTDKMTIKLTIGGNTYSADITKDTLASSILLPNTDTTNKTDYVQVSNPGYQALLDYYTANPPTAPATTLESPVLAFTPAVASKNLGLSTVSFALDGGAEGGLITMDQVGIAIGADGTVSVSHPIKGTVVVGHISLANFANPSGLEQAGTNYYKATANSGAAVLCDPGSDGAGALKSSSLEMSNVDMSSEFVDMITTQRGFQANSRIITVSDTMLEELVNLKR